MAATVADVYAHTNPDAVVTLLMHKVMRVAETQVGGRQVRGVREEGIWGLP